MDLFFSWFINMIGMCWDHLNSVRIYLGFFEAGLGWIIVSFLLLGIISSVLWKGARK